MVVNILLILLFLENTLKISLWIQQFNQENYGKFIYYCEKNKFYLIFIPLFPIAFDIVITSLIFSLNTYSKMHIITISIKLFIVILLPLVEFTCLCGCKYYYKRKYRIQVFPHFFIILFVHRLFIGVCVSVMFFIISPAQTMGITALLFFAILCAFIILTQPYILFYGTLFALIIMIIILFIALVDNGLQSSGMGGFILSIIPPIIAGIAGVYLKRLLFKAPNMHTGSLTNLNLIEHPARDQGSDNN